MKTGLAPDVCLDVLMAVLAKVALLGAPERFVAIRAFRFEIRMRRHDFARHNEGLDVRRSALL